MSGADAAVRSADPWSVVVGQDEAVAVLRTAATEPVHAWLFLGPPGAGARAAARVFAGEIVAAGGDPADAERHRRLAAADQHPDITAVERVGAAITVDQADDIVLRASRSPVEGARKVMILDEFHFVAPAAAGKLLKTIEEPPPGTTFVVLAEDVTPDMVTIASRCVTVRFGALSEPVVVAALQAEGVPAEKAAAVAAVAHGDLDRARLLAGDERLALRLDLWRSVPARLDGSGHAVAVLVDEIRATIDDAALPLLKRHEAEVAELDARISRYGLRGSGAKDLEARHRRESRRLRTDEVRMGLAELARRYRDAATTTDDPRAEMDAVAAVHEATEALVRNPSEELLLQALLTRLPHLAWDAGG